MLGFKVVFFLQVLNELATTAGIAAAATGGDIDVGHGWKGKRGLQIVYLTADMLLQVLHGSPVGYGIEGLPLLDVGIQQGAKSCF